MPDGQYSSVRAEEQITHRLAPEQSKPTPTPMLGPVVQQMTALAQCSQIARPVVRWIVIPVRRRGESGDDEREQEISSGHQGDPEAKLAPLLDETPRLVP